MKFIIKVYQEIVENEEACARPRSIWRVPTISELLGDECEIEQSISPAYSIRNPNECARSFSDT